MAEHLARTDKIEAPRKMRFSEQFTDDILSLITVISKDIADRYTKVMA